MRTLEELEEEAARLSHGFYWTMEWCVIMVGCYCVMGLAGALFIPVAIRFPWVWALMIAWYAAWFLIVPRVWRRYAAQQLIDRHRARVRHT